MRRALPPVVVLVAAGCASEPLPACADVALEVCATTAGCGLLEAYRPLVDEPTAQACWNDDPSPVTCAPAFDDGRCEATPTFASPDGSADACRWFTTTCVPEGWQPCDTLPTDRTCPACADDEVPTYVGPTETLEVERARAPAAGDVDGDGATDLVVSTVGGVQVRLAAGATFLLSSGNATTDTELVGAVGDLTGDGIADLVVASRAAQRRDSTERRGAVWVLEGPLLDAPDDLDEAAFARIEGARVGDALGAAVHLVDVDGDDQLDLVVWAADAADAEADGGRVDVHLGPVAEGDADPSAATARLAGADDWGEAVAVADLDDDGAPELLVGARVRGVVAFEGALAGDLVEGDGVRLDASLPGEEVPPIRGLAVGDLDDDGDADLVASVPDRSVAGFRRGELLVAAGPVAVAAAPIGVVALAGRCDSDDAGIALAVADVDGDGPADVIVGHAWRAGSTAGVTVVPGARAVAGGVLGGSRLGGGGADGGVLVADVDDDGAPEVWVADPTFGELRRFDL